MKQGIKLFFLIVSILSWGFICQEVITVGCSIAVIYLGMPCFIISSFIAILIPVKTEIKFYDTRLGGFAIWLSSIVVLIVILTAVDMFRNRSPILFSTKFYWEEGLDIEFREDGTFKAFNHDIMSTEVSYGKYVLQDSLIILKDRVQFGMEDLVNTLKISNSGVSFDMEIPWRIENGELWYEYLPVTEVDILNNTENIINSLHIKTYTTANISKVSVMPGETVSYKFDMKNPHVDGRYRLSYKMNNQVDEHRNFLNGYPLEMVEKIEFEEEGVNVNLITGLTFKLEYF